VIVTAVVGAFALVMWAGQVWDDGDTYWHVATGRWMLAHGQVPHADPFSFSHPGIPWQDHEWLSEILMALAWLADGWTGVLILMGLAAAAAAGIMARTLASRLGPIALPLTLALAFFCTQPSILARPHLIALPFMVGWTAWMLRLRRQNRAPPWWGALIMWAWANLHGSFVFGFMVAGALGLEALVEAGRGERLSVLWRWALFGLLLVLAALATPYGIDGFVRPFAIMGMKNLNEIVEWRPADFSRIKGFEISLLALIFVSWFQGVRVPLLRALLLIVLLHMSLQHVRHQIVAVMVAPLIMAQPLGEALGQPPNDRPIGRMGFAVMALLMAIVALLRIAQPAARPDALVTPGAALAHVPQALRARPVLNTYAFGGYLIFEGVKPFIDGRADMYGDEALALNGRLRRGDPASVQDTLKRYRIDWTILQPSEPLVKVMDAQPGWKRLYADRWAVVQVREDALAGR
jgi:hypothetical protein